MQSNQRAHIESVMQVAQSGAVPEGPDALIQASWLRCVHEHRLDPARMQEAVILPRQRLREHQGQLEDFLQVARHGLEALYQQVAGMGYAVLLTDGHGVTVDFIGDLQLDSSLRKAGLYLGADWSEAFAGTCGVGTCISTGQALTVHRDDHFDATHIPLTCTCAPIHGPGGELRAVLDISALTSPSAKASQHLALQLVKVYAGHVENADFLQRFRHDWILRLGSAPQFLDVSPEYLLALDANGRVIGHNRRFQSLLAPQDGPGQLSSLLGLPFSALFNAQLGDLGSFVRAQAADRRAITLAGNGQLLFLQATPPALRMSESARPAAPELPRPLAALSAGDPALGEQLARAARLVNSPISLLVTGETGSGKEYFAKAMHASSARRQRPFVAVNCAAIPEQLIESELFGHLPGSFSGAGSKGKRGLIQEADGGTLFLDEIGDMPLALQARLLRVLAEREVLSIGATKPQPVNIRVIAATHCDLSEQVRAGRFRSDLYYRINGAQFHLPPLRERADLGWVIDRLLALSTDHAGPRRAMGSRDIGDATEREAIPTLDAAARDWLLAQPWPGNLRQLHNVLEYARSICVGGVIRLGDLGGSTSHWTPTSSLPMAPATRPMPTPAEVPARAPIAQAHEAGAERAALLASLRAAHWNVTQAARELGLSRMTLYRRMKRWGIESPNRSDLH